MSFFLTATALLALGSSALAAGEKPAFCLKPKNGFAFPEIAKDAKLKACSNLPVKFGTDDALKNEPFNVYVLCGKDSASLKVSDMIGTVQNSGEIFNWKSVSVPKDCPSGGAMGLQMVSTGNPELCQTSAGFTIDGGRCDSADSGNKAEEQSSGPDKTVDQKEEKPVDQKEKKPVDQKEEKPVDQKEEKPVDQKEDTPVEKKGKSAEEENKLVENENKPVEKENQPAEDEGKTAEEEGKTAAAADGSSVTVEMPTQRAAELVLKATLSVNVSREDAERISQKCVSAIPEQIIKTPEQVAKVVGAISEGVKEVIPAEKRVVIAQACFQSFVFEIVKAPVAPLAVKVGIAATAADESAATVSDCVSKVLVTPKEKAPEEKAPEEKAPETKTPEHTTPEEQKQPEQKTPEMSQGEQPAPAADVQDVASACPSDKCRTFIGVALRTSERGIGISACATILTGLEVYAGLSAAGPSPAQAPASIQEVADKYIEQVKGPQVTINVQLVISVISELNLPQEAAQKIQQATEQAVDLAPVIEAQAPAPATGATGSNGSQAAPVEEESEDGSCSASQP